MADSAASLARPSPWAPVERCVRATAGPGRNHVAKRLYKIAQGFSPGLGDDKVRPESGARRAKKTGRLDDSSLMPIEKILRLLDCLDRIGFCAFCAFWRLLFYSSLLADSRIQLPKSTFRSSFRTSAWFPWPHIPRVCRIVILTWSTVDRWEVCFAGLRVTASHAVGGIKRLEVDRFRGDWESAWEPIFSKGSLRRLEIKRD